MKVSPRDADRACTAPAPEWCGILLYGADSGLIAERRQQLVAAVAGPGGSDLQVTQMAAADVRRAPADLEAALTTRQFFAGRTVVVVEAATDGLAAALSPVLEALCPEDGVLIVTADQLPARSRLRKTFEAGPTLAAIGLYARAPGAAEIEDSLRGRGVAGISGDAVAMLVSLASEMDHGAFRQFLDVIALHAMDRTEPVHRDDIVALAPMGLEGDIDGFVMSIADGDTAGVGPRLRRLEAGGATPVGVALALQRHFRALMTAAHAEAGIGALRPPPQGPRRDRIQRQLRTWTGVRLDQANRLLFELDARIRTSAPPPEFALLERTVLRLAMLASR